MNMDENKKGFWSTLPGFITAIAAFLTAITGLLAILFQTHLFSSPKNEGANQKPGNNPANEQRHLSEHPKIEPETTQIEGGSFNMGSMESDRETPAHNVRVNNFGLGKYEITVAQFYQFVSQTKYTTDAESDGDSSAIFTDQLTKKAGVDWRCDARGRPYENIADVDFPVVHISWNDAAAYCGWLSKKTGKNYRLPTEAEWEYAAGNGNLHTSYSWGSFTPRDNDSVGNVMDEGSGWKNGFNAYNDGCRFLSIVGSYKPNRLGLYDMTGNVWEWCSDWYENYKNSTQNNPSGPGSGTHKVYKGGGLDADPYWAVITRRGIAPPTWKYGALGFRVALSP